MEEKNRDKYEFYTQARTHTQIFCVHTLLLNGTNNSNNHSSSSSNIIVVDFFYVTLKWYWIRNTSESHIYVNLVCGHKCLFFTNTSSVMCIMCAIRRIFFLVCFCRHRRLSLFAVIFLVLCLTHIKEVLSIRMARCKTVRIYRFTHSLLFFFV